MGAAPAVALVADDDEFFRFALAKILTKHFAFARVFEAMSLDSAFDCLRTNEGISAAFFDLSMPGVESPANLKAVRDRFPDMLVVVVSASQQRTDILQSLEAGVHGYVPKSLGIRGLTAALQAILAGKVYVPASIAVLQDRADEPPRGRSAGMAADGPQAAAKLTPRQREILALLAHGKSNKEIAHALGIREGTVKVHMLALFRSLGVRTRSAAAVAATRLL